MRNLLKKSDRFILLVGLFVGSIALAHPYLKGFFGSGPAGSDLSRVNGRKVELKDVEVKIPEFVDTGGMIDLNSANKEKLIKLPGIGPVLAERIIAYRAESNGFSSLDELKQVSGIGAVKVNRIRERLKITD